jgi:hypothetical protein
MDVKICLSSWEKPWAEAIRDLGVVECILVQLGESNRTLYQFTITGFVEYSSEHNVGYLIREGEMDVSCGSQSGEEEFMQVFG